MSTKSRKTERRVDKGVLGIKRDAPTDAQALLHDIPGVARRLNTTVWAVRRLIWSNQLAYVHLGKKYLVAESDLRALVEKMKRTAGAAA